MSNLQTQLARTLGRLQENATECARSFTTGQLKVEYRVAFSTGAALPWRLMEIHRAAKVAGEPPVLRRMHCFVSAEALARSVEERTTWKARDQALVSSHLVRVRASIDAPVAGDRDRMPPQVLNNHLRELTATRQALRAQMCLTRPDRVIDLPKR